MNSRKDRSRTPRTRPARHGTSAPPARHRAERPAGADDHRACRLAFRLARALHLAGHDPADRKRLLLEDLCRAAGAERGVLAVTRTDLRTGRQELVSVVAGHLRAEGTQGPPVAERAAGGGTRAAALGPEPGPSLPPPCLDAFLPLDGLRLVACLMMARPPGGRRFSAADRALIDLLHGGCRWVYAHDVRLAATDVWALPPVERRILQDLLAGHDQAAIARRNDLTPAAAARRVAAVLERFGAQSRDELLARWGDDAEH